MFTLYKKNPKNNIKQFIAIKKLRRQLIPEVIYKTIESISFKGGFYLDIYNRPPFIISNDQSLIESLGHNPKKCKAVVTVDQTHPSVQECIDEKIKELKTKKNKNNL